MLPLVGFLPADDPRVLATIDATEERLTDERGLVYRYRAHDGLDGEEGTFLLCTFWLAQALALAGQLERARAVFERAAAFVNDVGLLAEEVDPDDRRAAGQLPAGVQPHRPGQRGVGDLPGRGDARRYGPESVGVSVRFQPWNGDRSPASHASRSPGVLRSQSGRISAVTRAEVAPEVVDRRTTPEPVAVVDAVHDEPGLEHERVRDHRIVVGVGVLLDVEVALDDAPRVGRGTSTARRPTRGTPAACGARRSRS